MAFETERPEVLNFSPGPSKLPNSVLDIVKQNGIDNYMNSGMSVMEISHRGKLYAELNQACQDNARELLDIPDNYKILLLAGGGSGQFAAVPLNLMRGDHPTADYIITGNWSAKAAKEAEKYIKVNRVFPPTDTHTSIPDQSTWTLDPNASYIHFCTNETIHGVEFHNIPIINNNVPLVADMSSNIMTKPIDVSKFGVIYAGAQKNIGCSGVTLVIVREDLLQTPSKLCPTVLEYNTQSNTKSIYNTPPTFNIYVMGEVFKWIKQQGGVKFMEERAKIKSSIIYEVIDNSDNFYWNPVDVKFRSRMNIPLLINGPEGDPDLEAKFVSEAENQNMYYLKGHRSVGGLRVSLFNAMTVEETNKLKKFMLSFKEKYSN